MLAPRQQVEHFLAGVADVTQQLVLVRGQIPIRFLGCVDTGGAQPEQYQLHFNPHTKTYFAQAVQPIKKCCYGGFGFQRLLYSGEHVFKTNPHQVLLLRLS